MSAGALASHDCSPRQQLSTSRQAESPKTPGLVLNRTRLNWPWRGCGHGRQDACRNIAKQLSLWNEKPQREVAPGLRGLGASLWQASIAILAVAMSHYCDAISPHGKQSGEVASPVRDWGLDIFDFHLRRYPGLNCLARLFDPSLAALPTLLYRAKKKPREAKTG